MFRSLRVPDIAGPWPCEARLDPTGEDAEAPVRAGDHVVLDDGEGRRGGVVVELLDPPGSGTQRVRVRAYDARDQLEELRQGLASTLRMMLEDAAPVELHLDLEDTSGVEPCVVARFRLPGDDRLLSHRFHPPTPVPNRAAYVDVHLGEHLGTGGAARARAGRDGAWWTEESYRPDPA